MLFSYMHINYANTKKFNFLMIMKTSKTFPQYYWRLWKYFWFYLWMLSFKLQKAIEASNFMNIQETVKNRYSNYSKLFRMSENVTKHLNPSNSPSNHSLFIQHIKSRLCFLAPKIHQIHKNPSKIIRNRLDDFPGFLFKTKVVWVS